MKVAKFGGSSLASAEQIEKICAIVTADPARRLVVVSAPGKRDREDAKVTDLLIEVVRAPANQSRRPHRTRPRHRPLCRHRRRPRLAGRSARAHCRRL